MSTCRTSLCRQQHTKEGWWCSHLSVCPADMFSKKENVSPDRAAAPDARRHISRRRSTALSSRLLKNAHLWRCPHPSSLRRTGLYVSLLGISGALYLSVFEQPANRVSFGTLLGWKCSCSLLRAPSFFQMANFEKSATLRKSRESSCSIPTRLFLSSTLSLVKISTPLKKLSTAPLSVAMSLRAS